MGDISGKTTLDHHFRFPTGAIQSSNQPVYHTPKAETYGPTPVPILAKKGEIIKNKTLSEPIQSTKIPCAICGKDMVNLACSSSILFQINPPCQ